MVVLGGVDGASSINARRLKLTTQAADALEIRQIELSWIEATLIAADATGPDHKRPGITLSFKALSAFEGRILWVAHRQEGGDELVITAYFARGTKL